MKRKRFYLYVEHFDVYKELHGEAAESFLHQVFEYVEDGTIPTNNDPLIRVAFNIFKKRFDEDSKHYEEKCKTYKNNRAQREKKKEAKDKQPQRPQQPKMPQQSISDKPSIARKQIAAMPIEERKTKFADEEVLVTDNIDKYDMQYLQEFIEYWTKLLPECGLMRFEDCRYNTSHPNFDTTRRLMLWKRERKKELEAEASSFIKPDIKTT